VTGPPDEQPEVDRLRAEVDRLRRLGEVDWLMVTRTYGGIGKLLDPILGEEYDESRDEGLVEGLARALRQLAAERDEARAEVDLLAGELDDARARAEAYEQMARCGSLRLSVLQGYVALLETAVDQQAREYEGVLRERDTLRVADSSEAAAIAEAFHDAYETLAPRFGYRTREASARPWTHVPEQNRNLMTATVQSLLDSNRIQPGPAWAGTPTAV